MKKKVSLTEVYQKKSICKKIFRKMYMGDARRKKNKKEDKKK